MLPPAQERTRLPGAEEVAAGAEPRRHVEHHALVVELHPARHVGALGDHLGVEHHLRQVEELGRVEHADADEHVGSGQRRQEGHGATLVAGLHAELLGVARETAGEDREPVAVPHLGQRQVEEQGLGTAGAEGARLHVQDARVAHVHEGAARGRQLQGHEPAEDLGVGLDHGAGERDRRRRPREGEAVDDDRHALLGEQHRRVERLRVVLQRRDRAVDDREDRPRRVPHAAGTRGGGDFERVRHEARVAQVTLGVFAGPAQHRGDALQRLDGRRRVVGGGHVPAEAQLVEGISDDAGLVEVPVGRLAALARTVIEGHRSHAVVPDEGAGAVEQSVVLAVASGQQDVVRRRRHGPLDELGRDAHQQALVVDVRARVAQQPAGAIAGETHADGGEQLERALVQVRERLVGEQADAGRQAPGLGGPGHQPASAFARSTAAPALAP